MFLFLSLFVVLFSRGCTAQYCDYDVNKFQEITCFNITALEQITDQINATLVRDNSLPRLIEVVRLGKCELPQFTIQPLLFLPQLKEIEIFDSTITKLSYEENTNLTNSDGNDGLPVHTILMKRNHIKVIDPKALKGLGNLLKLDLEDNEITTISAKIFSGSTVQELILKENQITNFQLDNSNNLINITLQSNELKRVDLTSFAGPKIEKLDLSYNQLQVIEPKAFSSLKNLNELDLNSNRIPKIQDGTFHGSSIRMLYLGLNSLSDLGYNSLCDADTRLEVISLTPNNLITIHEKTFSGCTVQKLELKVGGIQTIERNSFNNVSFLQHIDLNTNHITNIIASVFSIPSLEILDLGFNDIMFIEPDALNGASNLRELYLNHNELTTVKKNMFSGTALQILDLRSNRMVTIEPYTFEGLNNLTRLGLGENRIVRLDEKLLPGAAIKELNLGYNPVTIEQGIFGRFNDLQVLDLTSSGMSKIPSLPVSVRILNFNFNNVASIKAGDFQFSNKMDSKSNTISKPALEVIEIRGNKISTIGPYAFSNLSSLRELQLHNNDLRKINKYSFAQSTIEKLDLRANRIAFIEPEAFWGLNLSILDLESNWLTKIEKNTFAGCSIRELILDYNQIKVIEPFAFSDVQNLYRLRLIWNSLGKVGRNIFTSSTLKVLHLDNEIAGLFVADFEQLSHLESVNVARNTGRYYGLSGQI